MTCPYRCTVNEVQACGDAFGPDEAGYIDPSDFECVLDCRYIKELEQELDKARRRLRRREDLIRRLVREDAR